MADKVVGLKSLALDEHSFSEDVFFECELMLHRKQEVAKDVAARRQPRTKR